jgi:hypothetical protein
LLCEHGRARLKAGRQVEIQGAGLTHHHHPSLLLTSTTSEEEQEQDINPLYQSP